MIRRISNYKSQSQHQDMENPLHPIRQRENRHVTPEEHIARPGTKGQGKQK